MDYTIAISSDTGFAAMTFDQADTIMNNVYLSLMVRKGAFFARPEFGSRLHELARAKNTENTAALAKEYCREALQWLIDNGRATSIDLETERDPEHDQHRLKLHVCVTQADLTTVTFDTYLGVI